MFITAVPGIMITYRIAEGDSDTAMIANDQLLCLIQLFGVTNLFFLPVGKKQAINDNGDDDNCEELD
jgi:hypothetical protein